MSKAREATCQDSSNPYLRPIRLSSLFPREVALLVLASAVVLFSVVLLVLASVLVRVVVSLFGMWVCFLGGIRFQRIVKDLRDLGDLLGIRSERRVIGIARKDYQGLLLGQVLLV
jgi:hypothetical protein